MDVINIVRKLTLVYSLISISTFSGFILAQSNSISNPAILQGKWILDMTPENPVDSIFASMEISTVSNNTLQGYFYREGVEIMEGRINNQTGVIYAALVSGDGTGTYNTTFYYKNGMLYGSTHSLKKDFLSVWTGSREVQHLFKPSFKESKETTHKIPEGQQYTFGHLEVLENRSDPSGRTIKIPVYIFKSRSVNPKPDPIIYTVGGPGSTTMPSAQYMKYYQYLDDRDFILIEQRGNYYATPHLDCPEWANAVYLSNLPDFDESRSDSIFMEAAKSCKERLTRRGIDLNGYTTHEIAADIDDLTKVLEIDTYNLLTISYSTKIAQVLLRDYPDGIRSVVMDSPLPLEVSYDEESTGNLLSALDKLLSDCEADADCKAAFPNLKNRFRDYLIDKTDDPLIVAVDNPESGQKETFHLRGKDLITVFTAASSANVSDVPFEIDKLLNNDLSSVKEQLAVLFQKPGGGAGIGMRLSVWCAEESPFNDQEIIKKETTRYPEVAGLSPAVFDSAICHIWGVEKEPAIENLPIKSDVPVLLISGEYDEVTPTKWANEMNKNLTNSFHLIFKGWKHTPTTNWGHQCAMKAANDFFNHPNQAPLPDCFEEIATPTFKIE